MSPRLFTPSSVVVPQISPLTHYRVFGRIRDEHDDLDLSRSFFIRLFYEDFAGDPRDVEAGFLKSQLLVMVRKHSLLPIYFCWSLSHSSSYTRLSSHRRHHRTRHWREAVLKRIIQTRVPFEVRLRPFSVWRIK